LKFVVILLLLAAVGSLASGLLFLLRDKGQSDRTAKALTLRVGLSLLIFVILMAGYYFGLIPREGLR